MRMPTASDLYPLAGNRLPCLVGGEFISNGRSFDNIDPVNGRILCTVAEADAQLVGRAVQAAGRALRGAQAGRRGGGDRAVEPAVSAAHVEGGAGARVR